MADTATAKRAAISAERVIYYTSDKRGRILNTVCLEKIEVSQGSEPQGEMGVPSPLVFYAKGVTYLSNRDYADDTFSPRRCTKIAAQRAGKIAAWFKASGYDLSAYSLFLEKDYNNGLCFGKGRSIISGDKMQLLAPDNLSLEDRFWLDTENPLFREVERRAKAQQTKIAERQALDASTYAVHPAPLTTTDPNDPKYQQFLKDMAAAGMIEPPEGTAPPSN